MLPPSPPSPPSGPPRGTYFSRRNDATPLPPSPATTSIVASSKNFTGGSAHRARSAPCRHRGAGLPREPCSPWHLGLAVDASVLHEQGRAVVRRWRFLA